MNRRTLLKGVSAAAFILAVGAIPGAVPVIADGRRLRSTDDGRILVQTSSGWQTGLKLGAGLSVLALYHEGAQTCARIGFERYNFVLKSADGFKWVSC